jgi:glycosyltransferase involved in cell wall biosynthesis
VSRAPRICHLFSSFAVGGAEVRTAEVINALGSRFSHTIMATDGVYDARPWLDPGVEVDLVPPPPGKGSLLYGLPLYRELRRIAPDLLVAYNWGAIDGVIAAQLGRLCSVIYVEDGFGPGEYLVPKRRRVLARRLLLRTVYAMVVPSRTLRRVALERYAIPRRKLVLIPNGVDSTRFQPRRVLDWRRSRGIPDDAVVFGAVSALRPVKNLTLLLRAFARADLPTAWLVLVGDGPCRATLERLTARLALSERVIFLGKVLDPAPYYAAFDVFVMSSLSEQMPIALLQAMACGLPALGTDVGDIGEMLGASGSPVLVPRDEAHFASAMSILAARPELRAALGTANRTRATDRYALDGVVRSFEVLFTAAIERRPVDQHRVAPSVS